MKRWIRRGLQTLGYRVEGTRYIPRQLLEPQHIRAIEFTDMVCRRMFDCGRELTFLQVGAFDGITKDPLHDYIGAYGWRGVLIEPQPRAAAQLRQLYQHNNRITVVEAAIDAERGEQTLFTVESETAPPWAGGMASFQRSHILKHSRLIPGLEHMISAITVNCVLFDDVVGLLPTNRLDLLQIDAEGADARLLSLFPLHRVRPGIIHWEIKNLAKAEREDCLERLAAFGYRFAPSGDEDMLAVAF
jgi:FkbM family methyltransferase